MTTSPNAEAVPPANTLQVRSASHAYPVYVGRKLLAQCGDLIRQQPFGQERRHCAIVTDETVASLYAGPVRDSLRASGFNPSLVVVPPGERSKSMQEAANVADMLIAAGLDRHAFIVVLGGGVIGDLGGFVASIYYRGIPFVQIPTTVISQADSAVGGKTGVNTSAGKNLLGTFYPPSLVLADVDTLSTLPTREFNEGFAEVIKHGVIRDRQLLEGLSNLQRTDHDALTTLMHRNLEIKAGVVASDEFELDGQRALLNFGHTIGHAIEQAAGYGRFLHGEAISLGMVAAGRLSMQKVGFSDVGFRTLIKSLGHFALPVCLPGDVPGERILASLAKDKKFQAGQIRFVLTPRLGDALLSAPGQVTLEDVRVEVERLRQPL